MKKYFAFLLAIFLVGFTAQVSADPAPLPQIGKAPDNKSSAFTAAQIKEIEKIASDYLINNPNVLEEAGKKLREREMSKRENDFKKIKDLLPKFKKEIFSTKAPGRVVADNRDAKVIMVELTQYQCGHCKAIAPLVNKFVQEHKEIQFITVYWPFFGGDAIYAAKAALVMQKQNKFNEFNQAMLTSNDPLTKDKIDAIVRAVPGVDMNKFNAGMASKELDEGLQSNFKLAEKLGIMGTPSFIFANKDMTQFSLILGLTRNIENDLNMALKEVKEVKKLK
jgi:protein-disulfide isomerase